MERIGKYVIHQAVVTSGSARIVLCHDPDLQIPVAIKLFAPRADGPLSPAQQMARFVAEARTLASFDHAYIVGVKVMEQLPDGRPYFVMPFLAAHLPYEIGKDFADPAIGAASPDERDRPRRMYGQRALVVLKQLSAAALALHRRGMVHRFIRPSNILLTATQNGAIKLCDFSMVKLPERNLPLPDHWMGAAEYTAPEQRESATTVSPAADVYSIGLVGYRILTGLLPDPAAGAVDLPGDFPTVLVDLIRACTDPDPSKRPPHAGEVLNGLDRVPPPRPSPAKPVVQVMQPRRAAAAAGQAAAES